MADSIGTVTVAELDAAAEASGLPDVWAEIVSVAHDIARLDRDINRIRHDLDRLPSTPVGRALARRWYASVQRREGEIAAYRRHLERLRRDVGATFLDATVAQAPARGGRWIVVPGGSDGDG
jgi:hypothetical protein